MRRLGVLASLASLALAGCGPQLASLPPTPARAPDADPVAAARSFAWSPGERRFVVGTRTTILVAGDTSEARDTVVTTTHVTLRVADGAFPRRLTGSVDSVRVTTGGLVPAPPPDTTLPLRFEGTVQQGRVVIPRASAPATPAGGVPCAGVAGSEALLASVRDLLPSLPDRLAPGTRWEETTTTTACRGGLAITTTGSHRYHVSGEGAWDGRPATRIERTSTYTVAGTGEQVGVRVSTSGRGTGTGALFIDADAGRLIGATARSRLELAFVGGGQEQRVVQEAETVIRDSGIGARGSGPSPGPSSLLPREPSTLDPHASGTDAPEPGGGRMG